MADTAPPLTGHCLCGAVRFRADAEPLVQAVCHCTDCQRQGGSAYSVVVGVPRDALVLEGDSLASYSTVGEAHGTPTRRHFCSACGSPIFSVVDAQPDVAYIKAGVLDDPSWLEPAVEVWTRSAQPWTPQFEGVPKLETSPA